MDDLTKKIAQLLVKASSDENYEKRLAAIIDNEYNGYIIENRDSDEYIKDINTLLDNDKLRMKYSKNAILTSKKFYKDEVVKMWEKLLK